MSTYIVVDIGSCHENSLDVALQLIRAVKEAGADAAKFQFFSDAKKLAEQRNRFDLLDAYQRYQLPLSWLPLLQQATKNAGLEFLCSCFLPQDIPTVIPLVDRIKIASSESRNLDFILAHAPYQKFMIVSTGGCRHSDITNLRALQGFSTSFRDPHPLAAEGARLPWLWLLHCAADDHGRVLYPAPMESCDLQRIHNYRLDGFSDHTGHVLTGALAVAAGARCLEVHVKSSTHSWPNNPDAPHALTESKLAQYVEHVRLAERASGGD